MVPTVYKNSRVRHLWGDRTIFFFFGGFGKKIITNSYFIFFFMFICQNVGNSKGFLLVCLN